MRIFVNFLVFLFVVNLYAEISVFDAGNFNSPEPYGLNDYEKQLLKNKQQISELQSSLNDAKEKLDGLRSIIEGLSSKVFSIVNRLDIIDNNLTRDQNLSKHNFDLLKRYIEENRKIYEDNFLKTKNSLEKLTSTKPVDSFKNLNKKDIFKQAVQFINNGNKENLDKSLSRLKFLLKQNYKKAEVNFYIGEIYYMQNSYAIAIEHYQNSVLEQDKGSYIPKLLYHTAISFDKIGDSKNANKFYKALKIGYSESKEAKASPDRKE